MPYLILESEEGGMSHSYVVGNDSFVKGISFHRYCTPEDIELAKEFAEKSQIGDFVEYSKGVIVRVNCKEDQKVFWEDFK